MAQSVLKRLKKFCFKYSPQIFQSKGQNLMSRRSAAQKRTVPPDSVYNSRLVSMMSRRIMLSGKKSLANKIIYGAFKVIEERTGNDPLEVFEQAVRNTTPLVEVKARRVGGATYQVPMEVRSERGTALSLRWLTQFSRSRGGRTMTMKLANELIDAANETGGAVRKREETHRMAEANKAFAHYRY
jgi:small subunit ribosomal protein S7